MAKAREDYGIDAPTVVRNLAVIGISLLFASVATRVLLHLQIVGDSLLTRILRINGLAIGIVCCLMAFWMIASSKWLKQSATSRSRVTRSSCRNFPAPPAPDFSSLRPMRRRRPVSSNT